VELTEKELLAKDKVCLALDGIKKFADLVDRVEQLSDVVGMYKIGKASHGRFGQRAVRLIHDQGAKVFLDLKYHDTPNTVYEAVEADTQLGVYMLNVHAMGGEEMLISAVEASYEAARNYEVERPKVIGVTLLTSVNEDVLNRQLKIEGSVEDYVLHLAKMCEKCGLDGIVCSAADLTYIRSELSEDFMYVTPGIKRPNTPTPKGQKRVMTPGNAVQDGSSILVVGRTVNNLKTPEERLQAGYEVLQDMAKYI